MFEHSSMCELFLSALWIFPWTYDRAFKMSNHIHGCSSSLCMGECLKFSPHEKANEYAKAQPPILYIEEGFLHLVKAYEASHAECAREKDAELSNLKVGHDYYKKKSEELEVKFAAAKRDSERLEWMIENGASVQRMFGKWKLCFEDSVSELRFDTPREAIDACIESEKNGKA